ncbi:MAG: Gldg family protein [Phycisphaerae bacterium]|nr:Gldg family protein [Phycisphaerae bacterium]
MAVDKTTHVSRRRLVYGTNVAIQIVLVLAVVVAVIWFTQRYKRQADLTRTGVNSLNQRTEKLLDNLPEDVTLTAIYTVLSEYDERAQKRLDTVRDLLALYESAGHGRVTANMIDPMKDRARLPALLKRLREKTAYQDEAKVHQEILQEFPTLNQRIMTLIDEQVAEAERLLAANADLQTTVLREVSMELQRLTRQAGDAAQNVQELKSQEIPRYGRAVDQARSYLEVVTSYLQAVRDWVQKNASTERGLTPEALTFLQQASAAYSPLLTDINALVERTRGLEQLELEQLSDQLNRWANAPPVLVETAETAQLVPFNEVWPFRRTPAPAPDGDDREFRGEQAISSAVLKLTQKEKTAVVFARYGGPSPIVPDFSQMNMNMRQMPRAPYGVLNDLLGKENFITEDWDLKTQKTPPTVEDAARTIYVVFPPMPPEQTDPRRPPPEPGISPDDVQTVLDAVKESGMGIFLTGWSPPSSPMPGAPPGTYQYAAYLKSTWGIGVKYNYLILPFAPSNEDPKLHVPVRQTQRAVIDSPALHFTAQDISAPLQASPGGMDVACPLEILSGDERPAGVEVEPIAVVKESNDVWALQDVNRLNSDFREKRGTYRREDDLTPPFPLAVAATNDQDQRLVVFASSTFVGNPMLEMPGGIFLGSSGLQTYAAYPANPDLFINALHWLTNEADRISVGAQPTEVPRLDKLKDDMWLSFWRVFLVGLWPGLALVVGGGVWLFRRR